MIQTFRKDRKGVCKGAMSMTVQAQSCTPERVTDELLPLFREAAQVLRPLL